LITSCDATGDSKPVNGMDTERKKLSLAEKLAKSAKRVIEPLIKLPIYKQRAFCCLNH